MSELTQCNYCSMHRIKRDAKELEQRIVTRTNCNWGMGGINIYAIPNDVKVPGHIAEDGEFHKEYWVCWFMELADHCVC